MERFGSRALLLDVSRGQVHGVAALRDAVDRMAALGYNSLLLYLEAHAVRWRSHPHLADGYPALSLDDLRALDEHAVARGVALIPALQTLGHWERALRTPGYEHLAYDADRPWSLRPCPEAWSLLDDLVGDLASACHGPLVHAGLDEPFDLLGIQECTHVVASGYVSGQALAHHVGVDAYLAHALAVHRILTAHGRRMAMWDDVALHWPALLPALPRDVVLVDWPSGYRAMEDYPGLDVAASAGHEVWACAGTHAWHERVGPTTVRAHVAATVHAAERRRLPGFVLAHWDDAGTAMLDDAFWALARYSALARHDAPDRLACRDDRDRLFGALRSVYALARKRTEEINGRQDLTDEQREALHAEKAWYVPMDALDALMAQAGDG
jgi:hexosaminidase